MSSILVSTGPGPLRSELTRGAGQSARRGEERRGEEGRGGERKGKERRGGERKGEERRGEERKGEERRGKERRGSDEATHSFSKVFSLNFDCTTSSERVQSIQIHS